MSKFWYVVVSERDGIAVICSDPLDYMTAQQAIAHCRKDVPHLPATLHAVSHAEAERIRKNRSNLQPNECLAYAKPQFRFTPIIKTDWPRCLLSLTWYARFVSRAWKSFISIS
ncbi:MAG: hypothetical protein ACO1RA_02455 [Planctomycetaceae bacterium]